MRHILLTAIMLCFVCFMASAAPQGAASTVKSGAVNAANAARQTADAVNFDSIEANINAVLAEMPTDSASVSSTTVYSGFDDVDGILPSGMFGDKDGNSIAKLAVFGIFIMPPLAVVLIVLIVLYFRSRNKRAQYEAMARAAQNGVILPPIPDSDLGKASSPNSSAVSLIAVGIGIAIFFACIGEWELGIGIGCIPALVGAARLVTRILDNRESCNPKE